MRIIGTFCLYLFLIFPAMAQVIATESDQFAKRLQQLFPDAKISKMEAEDHYHYAFQMVMRSPLDHMNSEAGYFDHYVYLSHVDEQQPVVLITEGYDAKPRTYELSKLIRANQVQVEYRFYGKSRPDPIPWKYLKNDQAIEDYHQLVVKLKDLYSGKWISTGISKGGETVLIYKSKYPDDVDVAVPYVAPLINGLEDPRTQDFIDTNGSDECRAKIVDFQRAVLKNREGILAKMTTYSQEKEMQFTTVPQEETLEYAVLEFPFSFWQWGGVCDEIPASDSSVDELFYYLIKIPGISIYSDKLYHHYLPSFYQHMTELGYYGYDTQPVQDLLQTVHHPTNMRFAPQGVDMTYNSAYIKKVRDYVENKGDSILYIYGELDPWAACAPNPKNQVDALKMVLKGGSHSTRIKHFTSHDQQIIFEKLKAWLGDDLDFNLDGMN